MSISVESGALMAKYIIKWNCGYGDEVLVIDAENYEDARDEAAATWKKEIQDYADYDAFELNNDTAEQWGLEGHLDEE